MPDPINGVKPDDPIAGAGIPNDPIASPPATETPGAQEVPPEHGTVPYQAMKEEREKRQERDAENEVLRAQLAALKQQVGGAAQYDQYGNPVQVQHQQQNPQVDMQKKLDEMWETDPRKAMQTENMMMMNWYDNINSQVDIQEDGLTSDHPDYPTYRTEVRKYIRQLPIADRGKPGIVKLAYFAVKGQNVDTILARERQAAIDKYKSGAAAVGLPAAGAAASPNTPSSEVTLTEDQAKACVAMGISPEDYVKNIQKPKA